MANLGAVSVGGGTLDIGAVTDTVDAVTLSSGTIDGTGTFTGSSYAVQSGTINAILGGGAALTKTTGGTVTLNGSNSYTGGTNVNGGILALGGSTVLHNDGAVTVGGGTFDFNGFSENVGPVTLTSGTITGTSGTLDADSYDLQSGTVSGILGGGGVALTKNTGGTVSVTSSSSYSGITTINAGVLSVTSLANAGSNSGIGNVPDGLPARLVFNGGTLQYTGGNTATDRGATLNATSTVDVSTSTTTLSWNGVLADGGGGLTKSGAGTLVLSNTNTYSGTTTVNVGLLNVTGSLANNGSNKVLIAAGALASTDPKLTRLVTGGGLYQGLGSTVTSGLGTAADILAGTNASGGNSVSMQWRLRAVNESTSPASPPLPTNTQIFSEVLSLTGMALSGGDTGQTDSFVLQMSYDQSLVPNEAAWAAAGGIYLGTLSGGTWHAAVNDNFSGAPLYFQRAYSAGLDGLTLGHYGVDTANNVAWAVVDHNSLFAVIPEPSSFTMLLVGSAAVGYAKRRRNRY